MPAVLVMGKRSACEISSQILVENPYKDSDYDNEDKRHLKAEMLHLRISIFPNRGYQPFPCRFQTFHNLLHQRRVAMLLVGKRPLLRG